MTWPFSQDHVVFLLFRPPFFFLSPAWRFNVRRQSPWICSSSLWMCGCLSFMPWHISADCSSSSGGGSWNLSKPPRASEIRWGFFVCVSEPPCPLVHPEKTEITPHTPLPPTHHQPAPPSPSRLRSALIRPCSQAGKMTERRRRERDDSFSTSVEDWERAREGERKGGESAILMMSSSPREEEEEEEECQEVLELG